MMLYLQKYEDCLKRESISLISVGGTDHQWFAVRPRDGDEQAVYGDPWANGPAALESHFSVKPKKGLTKQKISIQYSANEDTASCFSKLNKKYTTESLNKMYSALEDSKIENEGFIAGGDRWESEFQTLDDRFKVM
jgi:hypothetical protein